jgi:hypothetical protein
MSLKVWGSNPGSENMVLNLNNENLDFIKILAQMINIFLNFDKMKKN